MTTERKRGWLRSAAALALSAITLLPLLAVKPAQADPPSWARAYGWRHHRDRDSDWARDYNRDYRSERRARRHMRRRMRRVFRNGRYYSVPYGTTYVQPYGTYYTPGGYWVR